MPKNRSTAITLFGKSIVMMLPLTLINTCYGQGKQLTRPRAKELIAVTQQSRAVPTIVLEFDNKLWNDINVSSVGQWMSAYNTYLKQDYKNREQITNIFKELGFVEYRPVTEKDLCPSTYGDIARNRAMLLEISKLSFPSGIPHLTAPAIGEVSLLKWTCKEDKFTMTYMPPDFVARWGCDVPLAKGTNIEVTGITQDGTRAYASYTRSYIPNEIGKRFLKEIGSFPGRESLRRLQSAETGQATFVLYDDGWRIVR